MQLTLAGGQLHHKLVISFNDKTPSRGVEGSTQYRCYVRFYLPTNASNVRLGPTTTGAYPNDEKPAGLKMVDGWFWIHPELGKPTWTLTLEYDTRWDPTQNQHAIYWQKQPGTGPDPLRVTWSPAANALGANGKLTQDQVVVVRQTAVLLQPGLPATAHLPALTL
jgi:hypothetical protein